MKKFINGEYVEMTTQEIAEMEQLNAELPIVKFENDALAKMATAMSSATTIAQMREAAKLFLEATGVTENV